MNDLFTLLVQQAMIVEALNFVQSVNKNIQLSGTSSIAPISSLIIE